MIVKNAKVLRAKLEFYYKKFLKAPTLLDQLYFFQKIIETKEEYIISLLYNDDIGFTTFFDIVDALNEYMHYIEQKIK